MSDVLTVAQLTQQIRLLLEEQVGEVWVEGEISNHRLHSSGHQYFTLKDERSQIQCVLFRGSGARLGQPLRDGVQVQIFGEVTVYEQRGNYQIIVQLVQPKGVGSLQARFEALKRKLAEEGLFDEEWKKPIPRFPRVVALVTSPTGAAIRDMLNILTRRAPWLRLLVFPVRVQGQGGEAEIARAVELLNRAEEIGLPRPDTIVVGRGGGSLEDLWNFNEEIVARAIYESEIPVISAVGHEIDFTIADFVADLRAPTPSAAAELLAPDGAELRRHLDAMQRSLSQRLDSHAGAASARAGPDGARRAAQRTGAAHAGGGATARRTGGRAAISVGEPVDGDGERFVRMAAHAGAEASFYLGDGSVSSGAPAGTTAGFGHDSMDGEDGSARLSSAENHAAQLGAAGGAGAGILHDL